MFVHVLPSFDRLTSCPNGLWWCLRWCTRTSPPPTYTTVTPGSGSTPSTTTASSTHSRYPSRSLMLLFNYQGVAAVQTWLWKLIAWLYNCWLECVQFFLGKKKRKWMCKYMYFVCRETGSWYSLTTPPDSMSTSTLISKSCQGQRWL